MIVLSKARIARHSLHDDDPLDLQALGPHAVRNPQAGRGRDGLAVSGQSPIATIRPIRSDSNHQLRPVDPSRTSPGRRTARPLGTGALMNHHHYRHLFIMVVLSFVSMYVLMYAMVNAFANVYSNVNQFYMAGLMTAPMVVIDLLVMRNMYENKRRNVAVLAASMLAGVLCFVAIRRQTAVSDGQFLRSMIPHHASAILMCQRAPLEDPEIRSLCASIVTGQQAEIDQMRAKLRQIK
jgi:hypothetical protein